VLFRSKLRYDDFRIATRDRTIDRFVADAKSIRQAAGQCLKRVPLERPLRLIRVRVGALVRADSAAATVDAAAPSAPAADGTGRPSSSATTASLF
jgi:DNA polymerase-4